MSTDTATASLSSSPSSSTSSSSSSSDVTSPAVSSHADSGNTVKPESAVVVTSALKSEKHFANFPMSLSSPIHFPMLPLTANGPLLSSGSLFPSPFMTSTSLSSPVSPNFTPDSLQSLLISLRATSSPTASAGSMPLVPIQLLPGPLLVLPSSLHSPHALQRYHSLPHPKLLTFSTSSVMHEDIPSSLPCPPSPTPIASSASGSAMEISPYTSPHSPLSPLSGSSTDSDESGRDSDETKNKHSKRKSRKSLKRTSFSETDNDDTDSTHSASSSSSSSSSEAPEGKKRRCVVSAQKLLTDSSAVDLSLSIVHFHHHSIRIIHTHSASGQSACYVHGADVGGVIERKSNISRMFGQFESPREKVLMNVTGKHNHTVGQEANVLTVAGVERLMTLKKCAPNVEYCDWLRTQLLPRLKEGNAVAVAEEEQQAADEAAPLTREKSEAEGEVVHVMASLCTAAV